VVEDVVETGERPENEQDITCPDPDALGARSDPRVVAPDALPNPAAIPATCVPWPTEVSLLGRFSTNRFAAFAGCLSDPLKVNRSVRFARTLMFWTVLSG